MHVFQRQADYDSLHRFFSVFGYEYIHVGRLRPPRDGLHRVRALSSTTKRSAQIPSDHAKTSHYRESLSFLLARCTTWSQAKTSEASQHASYIMQEATSALHIQSAKDQTDILPHTSSCNSEHTDSFIELQGYRSTDQPASTIVRPMNIAFGRQCVVCQDGPGTIWCLIC